MSADTATLAAVLRVERQVGELVRRLDALEAAATPWPGEMTTAQAVLYARCSARTLYRWLRLGRVSDLGSPRRWRRTELDRMLAHARLS